MVMQGFLAWTVLKTCSHHVETHSSMSHIVDGQHPDRSYSCTVYILDYRSPQCGMFLPIETVPPELCRDLLKHGKQHLPDVKANRLSLNFNSSVCYLVA